MVNELLLLKLMQCRDQVPLTLVIAGPWGCSWPVGLYLALRVSGLTIAFWAKSSDTKKKLLAWVEWVPITSHSYALTCRQNFKTSKINDGVQ